MSSLKLKEMRKKVLEELKHIPSGPEPQNELRAIYWTRRMHSLGRKAHETKTATEVLMECMKQLSERYPNYEPVYDVEYFDKAVHKNRLGQTQGRGVKSTRQVLIIGDARHMDEVETGSIQLVVTSPPYWNLKVYGNKGLGPAQAYHQYINDIKDVLTEVKRVMEPGRFVCINVGTAVSNNGMESIPADIIHIMKGLDFIFKKEIIWVKPKGTQGLWQRGVTKFLKKHPYPCYFNLNIMHEYILIFQKKGEFRLKLEEKDRLPEEFIKKVCWSVWEMPVSMTKGHPAPFPEELPERIIRLYTVEGETVLDPFGGTGTTMMVARDLNRNCILYEINPEYLEIIKKKVEWGKQDSEVKHIYELKLRYEEKEKQHVI